MEKISSDGLTGFIELRPNLLPKPGKAICSIGKNDVFHSQARPFMEWDPGAAEKPVELTLRAKKGSLTAATVITRDYDDGKEAEYPMAPAEAPEPSGRFDYWKTALPPCRARRFYLFSVENGLHGSAYYAANGLRADKPEQRIRWFLIAPGFDTPEWSKGAIYYSIMPDSFYNNDPSFDPRQNSWPDAAARPWGMARLADCRYNGARRVPTHSRHTGADWFGGDLPGIAEKLPYIESMGADCVYTNPIFLTNHNAGYGQLDYTTVHPSFGSNADLRRLVERVHREGLKFITDGVWVYQVEGEKELNKEGVFPETGALQQKQNKYSPLITWKEWPEYETFFGARMNYENPETVDYIVNRPDSAFQYLLREPYRLDGWRLDVPCYNQKPGSFAVEQQMRRVMKQINPQAVLLGEVSYNTGDLYGDALDAVWNYESFNRCVYSFFGLNNMVPCENPTWHPYKKYPKISATEFLNRSELYINQIPFATAMSQYNALSTHDTWRVKRNVAEDAVRLKILIVLLMTYPGSASIFYGDEIGFSSYGPHGGMMPMEWNPEHWDHSVRNAYRSLICLRKEYREIVAEGAFKGLFADDEEDVCAYARFNRHSAIITLINNSAGEKVVRLPLCDAWVPDGALVGDWENGLTYRVSDGFINAKAAARSAVVLVYGKKLHGDYLGAFENGDIGRPPVPGHAVRDGAVYSITGSGSVGGKEDALRFVSKKSYGNSAAAVKIRPSGRRDKAMTGLMIRRDKTPGSPFFAVFVQNGEVGVGYREFPGSGCQFSRKISAPGNLLLKIERRNNRFTGYFALSDGEKPKRWEKIDAAGVNMPRETETGMFLAGGDAAAVSEFAEFETKRVSEKLCDTFQAKTLGALWSNIPDASDFTLEKARLVLKSGGSGTTGLFAYAPQGDWSARAVLAPQILEEGGSYGVTACQNNGNRARAYRRNRNGRRELVFELQMGGYQKICKVLEDPRPDSGIFLQIQRVGVYFSAMLSLDGKAWSPFYPPLQANFSEVKAGIFVSGGSQPQSGAFEGFGFGNSLENGRFAMDAPFVGKADLRLREDNQYRLRYISGNWAYTDAGFRQDSAVGGGRLDVRGHRFESGCVLEAEIEGSVSGEAGVALGRAEEENDPLKEGILLTLCADGALRMRRDGSLLYTVPAGLDFSAANRLRIYTDRSGGLRVYVNKVLLLDLSELSAAGYVSMVTLDSAASFRNLASAADLFGMTENKLGAFSVTKTGGFQTNYTDFSPLQLSPAGLAFNGVAVRAEITLRPENGQKGSAGFLLCAPQFEEPVNGGAAVFITPEGKVALSKKGRLIAEKVLPELKPGAPVPLCVMARKGRFEIRAAGETVLNETIPGLSSGAVSLFADGLNAAFEKVVIEGINE